MPEELDVEQSRAARVLEDATAAAGAAAGVAQLLEDAADDLLTLPSGIAIRFRSVPPFAMRQAALSIPEPVIPLIPIEGRERPEPNPMHPAYLQAVADRNDAVYLAGVKVCLIMGTEVVTVPEGMFDVASQGWIDELEAADVKVDVSTVPKRKLAWIELYALRTPADIARVSALAIARAGLTETEVAATLISFLSHEGRRANPGSADRVERADGDPVRDVGAGAGTGA